jgi:VWFA-related protein
MKLVRVFVAMILLLSGALRGASVQSGQDRIRVQTSLVSVPVMVSDQLGRSIVGLKQEDFVLYDDGVPQRVAFFAAAEEPLRMVLMLDTSKSTAAVLKQIKKAATDFVVQLRPQDQAMVVSFDTEIHILCRFGCSQPELKHAIEHAGVSDDDGTHMRDVMATVIQRYLGGGQGRKAIILLTDGEDIGSSTTPNDAIRIVRDSGVVIYPMFYAVDPRELSKKLFGVSLPKGLGGKGTLETGEGAAAAWLKRVAEESAGIFYRSNVADLKKTFAKVASELRCQYLLAFYPDAERINGLEHSLRVSVSPSGLVVRSRRSYLATQR